MYMKCILFLTASSISIIIFRDLFFFGSYQELLDDKSIEAVYISLPNYLHVEWAIKALKAGEQILVKKLIY